MATPTVPKRFALLVGVDFYQNGKARRLPNDDLVSLGHLEGAVNDVKFISKLLQDRFQFNSVCTLTFSVSLNDPSVPRELEPTSNSLNDGRTNDLSLMTADYCCGGPAIRGWELNEWLWQFHEKGVRVIVLLDSCYSGGAWRTGSRFRSPENWTPPPNLPADEGAVQGSQRKPGHRDGDLNICWDLNPRDFTLMTAYLLNLLTPTYHAICDHTTNQLATWDLSQKPQVFGCDRLAFLEDYEPISATPIFGTLKDGILSLPVGKVHGINRGSEFITVSTGPSTIFSVSELYDIESKAKIVKGSVQDPSQSIRAIPYRWSSEKTLNIIIDPKLERSFQEKQVFSHLGNCITGNIRYTKGIESTDNEDSKATWFRLGVKEDGGIEIFGPKQVLGYQGPMRGWKTSGGTDDERAKESAIALAHLFRFGQIVHLRNESEDAAPFQVTVHPQPGENTENVLDVVFQNNDDKELYFAILILSPGFHVKQLFPVTDTLQAVLPRGRHRVSFSLTVPAELKHDEASDQQHEYRDIVRTVVTRGRNLSLKSMELPDIWNADQWDNKRTGGLGRDANLLDRFSWWIHDVEKLHS
ncbi:caspase domain-containing protein [Ustulina deusta]|nr:caspase domain-containing protein [Ustulina deusta]